MLSLVIKHTTSSKTTPLMDNFPFCSFNIIHSWYFTFFPFPSKTSLLPPTIAQHIPLYPHRTYFCTMICYRPTLIPKVFCLKTDLHRSLNFPPQPIYILQFTSYTDKLKKEKTCIKKMGKPESNQSIDRKERGTYMHMREGRNFSGEGAKYKIRIMLQSEQYMRRGE